ncbi:MAG: hypothetical protein IT324_29820 [Anaerolineae bacterium]|nr:hypothetical protein [Anaerolineae bacterium]
MTVANTTALVLVGHGSHISPQTAGIVWQHVDALRAMGIADEVTAAFWKETPSFHEVLNTLTATDITLLPLFTAQGYFTQTVIPTEMGLTGPLTVRDGRMIRYARTLGEHPYLFLVVRQRIEGALRLAGARPAEAAIAIIGHSTKRNPESRKATETQAAMIRSIYPAAQVVDVYLDDEPGIETVYDLTSAPVLIAVPYFLALGSHTTIDVPERLLLEPGQTAALVRNRAVYYTPPVGVDESLRDVLIELAREVGAPLRPARSGSTWDCFPAAGRTALIDAIHTARVMPFGQLILTPHSVQRIDDTETVQILTDPATLRKKVRDKPFRPLATSTDLPGGWRVLIDQPDVLHAVIETIYPGAVADWAAAQHGTFTAESLASVATRQTGMYRDLAGLSDTQCAELVAQVCGNCVRHPTWFDGSLRDIPCGEPCNLWLSKALEKHD